MADGPSRKAARARAKGASGRKGRRRAGAVLSAAAPIAVEGGERARKAAAGSSGGAGRKAGGARKRRPVLRRLLLTVLAVCLLAAAIPLVLTLIYRIPSVEPVSRLMLGERLAGREARREWVAFENIAPAVWQSVVSSEDGRFCFHSGVDWAELDRVIDDALEGEPTRGASTLAMQSVKNLFLWPGRSVVRKAVEVPLALWYDLVLPKRRQMEIYLNIAEMGPGVFGVGAAARHHFGRSAARLTRRQAALLAVSLPNPKVRNPRRPGRGMNRLARLVERRARQSGAYVRCLRG